MKPFTILLLVFTLCGCSLNAEVPEGSFGLLFRLGEVTSEVRGPAQLGYLAILEKVTLVNVMQESTLDGFAEPIRFEVLDPAQYYIVTRGSLSLDDVFEMHLQRLDADGIDKTPQNLEASIIRLDLPIRFVTTE